MASYGVRDVRFGSPTRYDDGVLWVDRDELRRLLLRSGDFADVAIEVARPGEAVRLIHVVDAAEPRYKPDGPTDFPGFVGPQRTVGEGRTNRLAGLAVVSVGDAVAGEPTYWREALIDMSGPGADATVFGGTLNLVLAFAPTAKFLDASQPEASIGHTQIGSLVSQRYNRSIRQAQLEAAVYLARTTAGRRPDSTRTYELTPVDPALPRVVYLFQVNGVSIYADDTMLPVPTVMHPNEILDGALINFQANIHAAYRYITYFNQNHAVIDELYARHGVDLNFVAAILYPRGAMQVEKKDMLAEYVVKLMRMLGAQGACSSYTGGGHSAVDFMMICERCERLGIKTVQLMPESYGTPDEPGFVYYVPEAVAIASMGRATQEIGLPAPARVIGGDAFFDLPDAPGADLSVPYRYVFGSCPSTGNGYLVARED